MRWLFAIALTLLVSPAFAFSCGDPIPSQASGAGYNTITFCWDSSDTISEIDTTGAGVPGKKFYLGTANVNGHATVLGDFSVVGGKIITQTSVPADHGAFVLNTCFAPSASTVWTAGNFFQNGWYLEFAGEWNATGNPGIQTGFYGVDLYWYPPPHPANFPTAAGWEIDNPDAFAFGQRVVTWHSGLELQNSPSVLPHQAPTVETGSNIYGILSTSSQQSWWFNNAPNGSPGIVDYTVSPGGGSVSAANFNSSKQCFGIESTSQFSMTLDFMRVIQAGALPVFGGGRGLRR